MKNDYQYTYFYLSYNLIVKKKVVLILAVFIEYFLISLDILSCFSNISSNVNGLYHINVVDSFRKLGNKSFPVMEVISCFFFALNLYYICFVFLVKNKQNYRINLISINYFEFFHIRILSIFQLECCSSLIIKYSNKPLEVIFVILFWLLVFYVQFAHINTYYIFFQVGKESIQYPFDSNSKVIELYFLVIKFLTTISNNYTDNRYLLSIHSYLFIAVFSLICISIAFYLYLIISKPITLLTNYNLHAIRLCFIIFSFTSTFIFIFKGKTQLFYIGGFLAVTMSIGICIILSTKGVELISVKKFNFLNILICIILAKDNSEFMKKIINLLSFHQKQCGKCDYCLQVLSSSHAKKSFWNHEHTEQTTNELVKKILTGEFESKILTNEDERNILSNSYSYLIEAFERERKIKLFSCRSLYKFFISEEQYIGDILYALKYAIEPKKITLIFIIKLTDIISSYKIKKKTVALNMMLFYSLLYETADLKDKIFLKEVKSYISITGKITKLIKEISGYLNQGEKSVDDLIKIGYQIHHLRTKNLIKYLSNKENIEFFIVEILTFLVEEITNIPVSKEKGYIKEDFIMNEDSLSFNYSQNKIIIIDLDINQREAKIKRTGKNLAKFIGKNFFGLFHHRLVDTGVKAFYDSVNFSSSIKEFKFLFENDEEELVNPSDKVCPTRKLKNFVMHFKLVSEDLNKKFFVVGDYSFGVEDVVVTRAKKADFSTSKKNNWFYKNSNFDVNEWQIETITKTPQMKVDSEEYIYSVNIHNFELPRGFRRKKMFKKDEPLPASQYFTFYKKKNRYIRPRFGNKEKTFSLSYTIEKGNFKYRVYLSKNDQKFGQSLNIYTTFNGAQDDDFGPKGIIQFQDSSSVAGSCSSQQSIFSVLIQKKNKTIQNFEEESQKYQEKFKIIIKISVIFCIAIVVISIFSLVFEINVNNDLLRTYDVYTNLRKSNRLFYNLMTSIVALVCIGTPGSSGCSQYFSEHDVEYRKANGNLAFSTYLYSYYENPIKINSFEESFAELKRTLFNLNDEKVSGWFNADFKYTFLTLRIDEMMASQETITFVEAINVMANSWTTIVGEGLYITEPIYIFTLSTLNFSNIEDKENLPRWKLEYYNMMSNYERYIDYWEHTQTAVNEVDIAKEDKLSNIVMSFIGVLMIFYAVLFFLVFLFVLSFQKLLTINIDKILEKMKSNLYLDYFTKKYKELSLLSKLYVKNPVIIFRDIESLNTKIQRELELQAKGQGGEGQMTPGNIKDKKKEKSSSSQSEYSKITRKYYILIIVLFIFCIIALSVCLILWIIAKRSLVIVFDIITENSLAANHGYNSLALEQIMVLCNRTQEEISESMNYDGTDYISNKTYDGAIRVIGLEKQRRKVNTLVGITNDYIDLDCQTFFSSLNDENFEGVDLAHPEENFRENFAPFCETLQILKYKEDNFIYLIVFYQVQKFVSTFARKDYKGLMESLKGSDLFEQYYSQFLIFRPFRRWFNDKIYGDSINKTVSLEKNILYSIFCIILGSEILVFLILFFWLFERLKKLNKVFIELKNTFKIVKK